MSVARRQGFTRGELEAVGFVRLDDQRERLHGHTIYKDRKAQCFHSDSLGDLRNGWETGCEALHDALLRLALAHPERAALALGEGWSITSYGPDWASSDRFWMLSVRGSEVWPAFPDPRPIPPEFDAALSRARKIAAAWERIEPKP